MKNYVLLWHDSARDTGGIKAKEDTNNFFRQENYQVIDLSLIHISEPTRRP